MRTLNCVLTFLLITSQTTLFCQIPICFDPLTGVSADFNNNLLGGGLPPLETCNNDPSILDANQEFVIPTLVHIYHDNGDGDLSDEQITEMIENFNNSPILSIAGPSSTLDLKLALIRKESDGTCTSGIYRYDVTTPYINMKIPIGSYQNTLDWLDLAPILEEHPGEAYLHIFIFKKLFQSSEDILDPETAQPIGSGAGFPPYFPNTFPSGVNSLQPSGIMIEKNWVSDMDPISTSKLLVHEVMHWLGIIHPWGTIDFFDPSFDACSQICETSGDFVCDTRPTQISNMGLIPCVPWMPDCPSSDGLPNDNNVMSGISLDPDCPQFLTPGQVERAKCFLAGSPRWGVWQEWNLVSTGARIHCIEADVNVGCNQGNPGVFFNSPTVFQEFEYTWHFGDGTSSSEISGFHEYLDNGTFEVILSATDDCGEQEVFHEIITIQPCDCNPSLPSEQEIIEEINITQLNCNSFVCILPDCYASYSPIWQLSDGSTFSGISIEHSFCVDTENITIEVILTQDAQNVSASIPISNGCPTGSLSPFEHITPRCSALCEGAIKLYTEYPIEILNFDALELDPTLYLIENLCSGNIEIDVAWTNGCQTTINFDLAPDNLDYLDQLIIDETTDLSLLPNNVVFHTDVIVNHPNADISNYNWLFMPSVGLQINENSNFSITDFSFDRCTSFWEGIIVLSDNSQPGNLSLQNGVVSGALNGVYTEDLSPNYDETNAIPIPSADGPFAGTINANNIQFLNNFHGLKVKHSTGQMNVISNCLFSWKDDYFSIPDVDVNNFASHVDFANVNNFEFIGCSFLNESFDQSISANQQWQTRGVGMELFNSKIEVNIMADNPNSISDFSGLKYGVHGVVTEFPWNYLRIVNSNFHNNKVGVYMEGVCYHDIIANSFYLGPTSDLPATLLSQEVDYEGVFQHDGAFYTIAENSFHKSANPQPGSDLIGIRVLDTDANDNQLYHNYFYNLTIGCQAEGNNSGSGEWEDFGLRFVCNEFNNCDANLRVVGDDINLIASVSENQFGLDLDEFGVPITLLEYSDLSSNGRPAFQDFDPTPTSDYGQFYNEGNLISYWCSIDSECTDEEFVLDVANYLIDNDFNFTCTEIEGVIAQSIGDLFMSVPTEWTDIQNDVDDISDDLEYLISALLDGGNTEDLIHAVEFDWTKETWELRDDLLSKSPYLSKEVLMSVADNTDRIPHVLALEIFIANPDVLRNAQFIRHLAEKEDPMPQYMIDLLLESRNLETFRTTINRNRAIVNALDEVYKTLSIKVLLNNYPIAIEDYLSQLNPNNLRDAYASIDRYIEAGDFENAHLAHSEFLSSLQLSNVEREHFTKYSEWIDLGIDQNVWLTENSPSQVDLIKLRDLGYNYWYTEAGHKALMYLYRTVKEDNFIPAQKGNNLRSAPSGQNISDDQLVIYPNPANTTISIIYSSDKPTFEFAVFNVLGQEITNLQVTGNKGIFQINTSDWSAGSYILMVKQSGNLLESKRFEIVH